MSSRRLLDDLDREMQMVSGLSVMLSEGVAAVAGINCTDLECLGVIETGGGATSAGELAAVTGLTTGAITGVIDRLEQAGFVRREPDRNDRRKVMVRLEPRTEEVTRLYRPLQQDLHALWSRYDDDQIALVLDFLSGSRAIAQRHLVELQTHAEAAPDARALARPAARTKRR